MLEEIKLFGAKARKTRQRRARPKVQWYVRRQSARIV